MKRTSIIALALSAILCGSCAQTGPEPGLVRGPVRFVREYVVVEPSHGRTRVLGRYYFTNASDDSVSASMSYPFPVDAHHASPIRVTAWADRSDVLRPLDFHRERDSIRWRLDFAPRSERTVRVEYVQQISRNHAIYIVTTTSQWGEPIELAEFEFRVPRNLEDVELSFEPDRVEDRGDTVVYFMSRTDFMPRSDLEVRWK